MRFPARSLFALLVLIVAFGGSARAEQIIYFTNGDSMPIRSYEVKGAMIHVDLGGNGFIAFPASKVDRIEEAGRNVLLEPSAAGKNGVMQTLPDPNGSFPVTGHRTRTVAQVPTEESQVKIDLGDKDTPGVRPFPDSPQAGKRQLSVAGQRRIVHTTNGRNDEGPRGTTTVGNRHAIGAVGPKRGDVPRPYVTTIAPVATPTSRKGSSSGKQETSGRSEDKSDN